MNLRRKSFTKNKSKKPNKKSKKKNNKIILPKSLKGGKKDNLNLLLTQKLSFNLNRDGNYEEVGLVHITEVGAISKLRDKISDFFNYFGQSGYEGSVYDVCRHNALKRLYRVLKKQGKNHKICGIVMEIDTADKDVFVHAYGTLYRRKQ